MAETEGVYFSEREQFPGLELKVRC